MSTLIEETRKAAGLEEASIGSREAMQDEKSAWAYLEQRLQGFELNLKSLKDGIKARSIAKTHNSAMTIGKLSEVVKRMASVLSDMERKRPGGAAGGLRIMDIHR